MKPDVKILKGIYGADRIIYENISPDYSHDELGGGLVTGWPDCIVFPLSTEEVAQTMKYAYANDIPVVARGSGTGLVGASVAIHGGIMLDFTRMNSIIELDNENLTVTVQPGVLLMDLSKFVEDNDLFYPPDPGEKSATIGGNISTNAGGMRAVKYGVTRDYVRGLTVVMSDGRVMQFGGKAVKNSSGYALKDLVCGSEGTLCIITEAVLKLLPLPKIMISLLIPFGDAATAIETVPKIIRSKAIPTAIEFMERQTILYAEEYLGKRFPDTSAPAYLLLTFDGSTREQVEDEYEATARLCIDEGALDVFLCDTDERKRSVWSARGAFLEAIKASTDEMDECDVVVPRRSVAEFVMFTHELSERIGMRMPLFGHAGDGNLHVYLCRDGMADKEWKSKLKAAFTELYGKSAELNGFVSGEHGIGYAKREYLYKQVGAEQIELMKSIKHAFDPKKLLNPGKLF